jgi:hypothetical protein
VNGVQQLPLFRFLKASLPRPLDTGERGGGGGGGERERERMCVCMRGIYTIIIHTYRVKNKKIKFVTGSGDSRGLGVSDVDTLVLPRKDDSDPREGEEICTTQWSPPPPPHHHHSTYFDPSRSCCSRVEFRKK